jgi:hypothetical protein
MLNLPSFTGRRDGSPAHVRAIVDSIHDRQATEHTWHIDAYVDHMAYLEFLDEEAATKERMQEERDEEERQLARRSRQYQPLGSPLAPWNEL